MIDFCTPWLLLNILIFVAGSWILIKGSDIFVDSAAAIARSWGVSELVIGLTLVSIGTSLPELASSTYASMGGQGDFVIGNIIGSNITNITLILGAGVLFGGRMAFDPKLLSRDMLLLNLIFIGTALLFFFVKVPGIDGASVHGLNRICGFVLLAATVAYCWYLFKTPGGVENGEENPDAEPSSGRGMLLKQFALLILGLAMITLGSKAMVDTVVWGAYQLKIDTMIISATIVAFGTSVPELAVTIAGVLKKRNDLAIGNIIGSCIFNILLIFGVCSVITPLGVNGSTGMLSIYAMVPVGLILAVFMYTGRVLVRWEGAALLLGYCAFLLYNVYSALPR